MSRFGPRLCKLCGQDFLPTGLAAKFCPTCGSERAKARNRERMRLAEAEAGMANAVVMPGRTDARRSRG